MSAQIVPAAQLAPRAPELPALADLADLGKLLAASGYFQDAREAAQAVVKVLAGRELGFGPIASMTGIFIVKGRVTLSANLMGAAIKAHRRYDYRILERTDERAEVAFFESGEQVGTSEFTMADAQRAALAGGENWKKYPRNMLLWRALSNGAKFYCPDAFSGAPVYTPDELGAEVDPETGEVIEVDETAPAPTPARDWSPAARAQAQAPLEAPSSAEKLPETAAAEGRPDGEATTTAPSAPADGIISDEELAKLREYLDALDVPEPYWRMPLISFGLDDLAELSKAQAHELMLAAKAKKERDQGGGRPETVG